ncbi:hypothetical protein [uncultured Tateyamaria sp.]|uniref:hypothetical protein n=1 Tax=uncultured Tateyamaria sp. TaxID=455651 RepID=UPI0026256875|nr:hypothetical protein [uncultured Tateyamaria sp.]
MFVMSNNRQFTTTCTAADGQTFDATFKLLPDDEIDDLMDTPNPEDGVKALLGAVLVDLGDVVNEMQEPIAFEVLKEPFLKTADLRAAMLVGFRVGRIQGASGN